MLSHEKEREQEDDHQERKSLITMLKTVALYEEA